MKYLESYHLLALEVYSRGKCTQLVVDNHVEINKEILELNRGKYVGFLYGVKVSKFIRIRRKRINNINLYNHFKNQKNNQTYSDKKTHKFISGVDESMYELMRYCSEELV